MSKLSKDEILSKINEKVDNVDLSIELIEDITDSFDDEEVNNLREEIEKKDTEINDLKTKYRERFFENKDIKIPEPVFKDEKVVIDIREI